MYGDVDETAPVTRTLIEATEGDNRTITVVVKANPDPTSFVWTMTYYMDPTTNETKDSVQLGGSGMIFEGGISKALFLDKDF